MDPSSLLSDEAFARRIAIGLLRDREGAEELVQEAWLELLEKRPSRAVAAPRGYLASLLRRLWFRKRRGEERRAARERASAREETQGDTTALVARAEIHRRTVAAVLALDEPYRSTILLRFFEDRTAVEIAAFHGIPVETARTRLKRALAMLRARLEKEGRDWREEWAVALAGASRWPDPEPFPMSRLLPAGAAVGVATVVLVVWFARAQRPLSDARSREVATEHAGPADGADATGSAAFASQGRAALEREAETSPSPDEPLLSGRVRDAQGRPLTDVRVLLAITRFDHAAELALATSDASGSFSCSLAGWNELSRPARSLLGLEVEAWKRGHALLDQEVEVAPDGLPRELDLVLEPGRSLSGRVLGPAGDTVAAAFVKVRTSGAERGSSVHGLGKPADGEGRFVFALAEGERVEEVQVCAPAHGFAHVAAPGVPANTTGDVELAPLTLQRGHVLRGRCSAPDGTPVAGLRLQLHQVERDPAGNVRVLGDWDGELGDGLTRVTAVTDELGRFEAFGLGDGLFRVVDAGGVMAGGALWRSDGPDVELALTRHRLRVTVVDPTGRPLEEARLAVTRLSSAGEPAGVPVRTLTSGEPPVAPLQVEPGESLALLAVVPGCVPVEERFVVPHRPYEPELRLELVREERRASLRLRPSAGPSGGWRVDLCAPISGLYLPGFQGLVADPEGRVHGLPVGPYRVRIEPPASPAEALPERCAVAASVPVVLSDGETDCEFVALPAARLRLLFTDASMESAHPTPMQDLERHGASTERFAWLAPSMSGRSEAEEEESRCAT